VGVEILSTGGTSKALREENLPVVDVSDYTNFPEIMDGRVKTINPLVEGGILGLRDQHASDADNNNIKWIDLVVCNLYPFSETISRGECDLALALENIDIGGPTMIRSAPKAMACSPDEQNRLIVTAEASVGMPARKLAILATFIPCSLSGMAHPRMTSSTSTGSIPLARDNASVITVAAISSGLVVRSIPLGALPTAVRTADTITATVIFVPPVLRLSQRFSGLLRLPRQLGFRRDDWPHRLPSASSVREQGRKIFVVRQ